MKKFFLLGIAAITLLAVSCSEEVTLQTVIYDFENQTLGETGYVNGPDKTVSAQKVTLYGTECTVYYGKLAYDNASFSNTFNETWASWSGFAFSQKNDKATAGFTNQYSVYANSGANNSSKFAVSYAPAESTPISNISFSTAEEVKKMWVNNSTYAALTMLNGDTYTPKFKAGDWTLLTITGFNGTTQKGKIECYLADYRNGKAELLSNWKELDLSSLGLVSNLEFIVTSSQSGVPSYFCLDNLETVKP